MRRDDVYKANDELPLKVQQRLVSNCSTITLQCSQLSYPVLRYILKIWIFCCQHNTLRYITVCYVKKNYSSDFFPFFLQLFFSLPPRKEQICHTGTTFLNTTPSDHENKTLDFWPSKELYCMNLFGELVPYAGVFIHYLLQAIFLTGLHHWSRYLQQAIFCCSVNIILFLLHYVNCTGSSFIMRWRYCLLPLQFRV